MGGGVWQYIHMRSGWLDFINIHLVAVFVNSLIRVGFDYNIFMHTKFRYNLHIGYVDVGLAGHTFMFEKNYGLVMLDHI
jgi:hypothetical protein